MFIASMMTEADTCRKYVLPKLIQAGWDNDPHSFTEQKTFTDGRIVGSGDKVHRRPQKRADYLLRYTRDFTIGDFFDLVIVDECHRGSTRDASNWREILEYFSPAFQLGMTATPLRADNRDTYKYFGKCSVIR